MDKTCICVCVYIYMCIYHIYMIGEPGGLQSTELKRVGHDWETSLTSLLMRTSLVAQTVKRLSTEQETWVQSLGRKDPLEKETATRSSNLAWKMPWTEEPGRLQSMGSLRVGHDWGTSLHFNDLFLVAWVLEHAHSVVTSSFCPHELQLSMFLCPWDLPGKNFGVGCHFLLQGSSWPMDQTCLLRSPTLAVGFFTTAPPGKPCD